MGYFLHFYPLTSRKIKLKTEKKTPGDIIILHMRNINENHMMHGYWDIDCDRQNFCHFEPFFCPFTPLTTQKIKILKKWNKNLEISSIYTCVLQMTIIWCTDHDIHIFLSFWAIFCPFTPLTTLKIKILNKWKKHLEISSI